MARKQVPFVIDDEGRDKGKTFIITEMPADQGERWALRALLALARSDVEMPTDADITAGGWAGMAYMGMKALQKLDYESVAPLLAEMMTCVQYRHAPTGQLQPILEGEGCQIEEIKTFLTLRQQVFNVHAGFLQAGKSLISD